MFIYIAIVFTSALIYGSVAKGGPDKGEIYLGKGLEGGHATILRYEIYY